MRALFIGGTGTISMAISRLLVEQGWELYLLNRGSRKNVLDGQAKQIIADISKEQEVAEKIAGMDFDVVCDFIGFVPEQVERDYRLFAGKTKQYMYISSASAYHKPVMDYRITEGTTLSNPHWEYSRNKIACEEFLMKMYRENGFPVTIIRPSHTYDERNVPIGVHGDKGSFQVLAWSRLPRLQHVLSYVEVLSHFQAMHISAVCFWLPVSVRAFLFYICGHNGSESVRQAG